MTLAAVHTAKLFIETSPSSATTHRSYRYTPLWHIRSDSKMEFFFFVAVVPFLFLTNPCADIADAARKVEIASEHPTNQNTDGRLANGGAEGRVAGGGGGGVR